MKNEKGERANPLAFFLFFFFFFSYVQCLENFHRLIVV